MSSTAPVSPDTTAPDAAADVIHNGNPYFEGKPASITREYPTQLHAIGPDGRLRLGAAFDLMQDIAGAHAEILGVGIHDLRRLGITWVLSRLMIKFDALPPRADSVRLKTWPSGVHRLFAMRQFVLSDPATGQRIATASSYWLMLKLSNLRPVSPMTSPASSPRTRTSRSSSRTGASLMSRPVPTPSAPTSASPRSTTTTM